MATRTKIELSPNEQNVDRILRLNGTSLAKVMRKAIRENWPQRQLSQWLETEHGATLSQFGCRTLIRKYKESP